MIEVIRKMKIKEILTDKTLTTDTYKKITSDNKTNPNDKIVTLNIDVDPLFHITQQIIEEYGNMIDESELEDIIVNKMRLLKNHDEFQKEMKRINKKRKIKIGGIK